MELFTMWTWIFLLFLFVIAYWYLSIPKHLPPGTAGLPILGYIPFTNKQAELTFTELGKTYGNLFHVYMGSQLTIVLNDFATIKEALVKQGDVFSGRCHIAEFEEIDGDHAGVAMTDGEYWKQHRRFILHNLRDYGVGKPTLEPLLLDEIQHLLKELDGHVGKTIQFKDFLSPSLANNILILVTGKRIDYGHPSITGFLAAFKAFEKMAGSLLIPTFFPWIRPIFEMIYFKRAKEIIKVKEENMKLVEDVIRNAKDEYIEDQNEYYLQAYLTERLNRLKINKNDNIFSERGLTHNTRDLLGAGTDTASSTLSWSAIYMALYPEVLKKVQQEIDRTIGNREPSYNDRGVTHYTEATICELHRVISLIPLSLAHRTIRRTNLLGYEIPKDAMIFPNLWAVHNDKKLWGDPENFRPERFLNERGECVKPEYLIPFSIGKRACAGEPLARMEIYLYFVSFIQNFEFEAPPGEKLTTESVSGFSRQPRSKMIRLKRRNVYFGSQLTIVLNDFATIKEAFVKQGEVFSGRCPIAELKEHDGDHAGVVLTDGEYWKQHRRFILHNLRDYGVGKPTLEPLLLDEIRYFLKELRDRVGKTIEFKDFLSPSLANNIHILVTGRRFDYDSPPITGLIEAFKTFEKLTDSLAIATFFPWVEPILDVIYSDREKELTKARKLNIKLVEDAIREAKDKYIEGQDGNYLKAYMTERINRLKINKDENIFSERGLIHNTRDLLLAGTDTSASTLAWVAIYMALYPEVLKKVQLEIDRTIGNREPSYNDRGTTPYTEATIWELHRVISLFPLSVPHRTIRKTNLLGYEIPKNAMIFPNLWAVHNDKKLWGDPENFRPERFLNERGECVKPEYLIPFSIGKRACAGEPLARMEIYLYFVSLVQNFEFEAPSGEKLTIESTPGFARQPRSKMIRLKMR